MLKVKVTQYHIDSARNLLNEYCCCDQSTHCPVALAIKELTHESDVGVTTVACRIVNQSYDTPYIAVKFIEAFDNKEPVNPIEFELV